MIDELIRRAAAKTSLNEDQARRGLAAALGLIQKHGEPGKVEALLAAVPGAAALAAEGLKGLSASGKGGLMASMMRSAGGGAGAAMSDAMAVNKDLARQGITTSDMQTMLPVARDYVRESSGQDLLSEVIHSVPGVGKLLMG